MEPGSRDQLDELEMAKTKRNIVKLVPDEMIMRKIHFIRGQKVLLDYDLAALYEVETKVLNQAVKRNIDRFPEDFMFRLTLKEWQIVRSQIVTSQNIDFHKDTRMRSQSVTSSKDILQVNRKSGITPYAFTEHGVTMLASILKSERAVKMSIAVVRAFIELKRAALQYTEVTEQLKALKQHIGKHDVQLNQIYEAIENLLNEKANTKTWEGREKIGFKK